MREKTCHIPVLSGNSTVKTSNRVPIRLALENLEKQEKIFQSGKGQGISKFYQKVREKSGISVSHGRVREN